jgi:hypothetical protein
VTRGIHVGGGTEPELILPFICLASTGTIRRVLSPYLADESRVGQSVLKHYIIGQLVSSFKHSERVFGSAGGAMNMPSHHHNCGIPPKRKNRCAGQLTLPYRWPIFVHGGDVTYERTSYPQCSSVSGATELNPRFALYVRATPTNTLMTSPRARHRRMAS